MRPIKFRAKKIDGVWVFGGGVWTFGNQTALFGEDEYQHPVVHLIDPETVGQFTGLPDKNGKEIYRSDRIRGYGCGFSTSDSEVHFNYDGTYILIGDHKILLSTFIEIEVIGRSITSAFIRILTFTRARCRRSSSRRF